jgi:hypothetical protein
LGPGVIIIKMVIKIVKGAVSDKSVVAGKNEWLEIKKPEAHQ